RGSAVDGGLGLLEGDEAGRTVHAAGRAGAGGLSSACRMASATVSRSDRTTPWSAASCARSRRNAASSSGRQANVLLLARRFAAPSLIATSPPRPRCSLVLQSPCRAE